MKSAKVVKIANQSTPESEHEKDIWDVRNLGIEFNQAKADYKLNFTTISQPWLKQAAKQFIKYYLANQSWAEGGTKLRAIKHFSQFLKKQHPFLQAEVINRCLIVELISYLASSSLANRTRRGILVNIRQFTNLCAREGWLPITKEQLIYDDDMPKDSKHVPRYIPQEVLTQLNQHIEDLPTYIRRLVLVLQGTGRRVSEVCLLPFNPLLQDASGDWFLKHRQFKMNKEDTIPITRDIAAIIQEQQQAVREDYGEDCQLLFPNPPEACIRSGKRRIGKPIYAQNVNDALNRLAKTHNIRDSSGQIWPFQSHQFRHTVGTSMINNGVPIHIVKRYLGHETFDMTMRYAHIHDKTLKEEFINFQGKIVDIAGQVTKLEDTPANSNDLQWMKKNIGFQALSNGTCTLPVIQSCPHANACLTCTHFRTTTVYLSQHQEQLSHTQEMIQSAKERGWQRQVEMNEQVAQNLQNIINALEVTNE